MFKPLLFGLTVAVLTAGLTGCQTGPDLIKGPKTAARDPVPAAAYPNITFQGDLDQRLVLLGEPIVVASTPTTPMRVSLRLRNASDDPVWVQYRFRFLGENREPLDVDMPWQNQSIASTLAADFGARSMQVRAVDWELQVRPQQ